MKITLGDLEFTAEYKGMYGTYVVIHKDGVEIGKISSRELKEAIIALENTCWRP